MKPTCGDFDRLADPGSTVPEEERRLWLEHLEGCARCREQMEADRTLRTALASKPSLDFSAGFEGTLRRRLAERRLAEDRRPRPIRPAMRLALAGYTTAAGTLTAWILSGIEWQGSPSPVAAGVLLTLAAVASPLLLLPQSPLTPPGVE